MARNHTVLRSVDVAIDGQGFFAIHAHSNAGREWMTENVEGVIRMAGATFVDVFAYCDDSRLVRDIADGACEEGLDVEVNGRLYRTIVD